jgi:hypothetical protein
MDPMIYGKLFKKLYTGSMVGKGLGAFALMPYVVAHMEPDRDREEFVMLNPELLATTFGTTEKVVQEAIDFLCKPDPKTDTPGEDGRRLVQKSRYLYWVVNGKHYREIQNEEERREKAALRQQKHRDKKAAKEVLAASKAERVPLMAGETKYLQDVKNGVVSPPNGEVISRMVVRASDGSPVGPFPNTPKTL